MGGRERSREEGEAQRKRQNRQNPKADQAEIEISFEEMGCMHGGDFMAVQAQRRRLWSLDPFLAVNNM